MNRCTYCGKLFPDDVTVCPIDRNSVTADGKPAPVQRDPGTKARRKLEMRAHLAARPISVKIGVGLLALGVLIDTVWRIVINGLHPPHDPGFYFLFIWTLGFVSLVLYFAFQGKNWARWLILLSTILGTIDAFHPHHRISSVFNFYVVIDFIAIIALFLRASNEWFARTRIISQTSTPAA